MRLITVNAWGGRMRDEVNAFVTKTNADIYCFQEVYREAQGKDTIFLDGTDFDHFSYLKQHLQNYTALFHPHLGDWWGLAMFIRKNIPIIDSGEVYVHKEKGWNYDLEVQGYTAKNLQYATIETKAGLRTVLNFHGLWNGQGKDDSTERMLQSQNIVAFLKTLQNPYILAGDFNLNPTTESMNLLESHGLRNLIKEYGYTSTRTPLYEKEGKFADYVLVSGDIEVLDFSVLPDVVSDHSPLLVEFD